MISELFGVVIDTNNFMSRQFQFFFVLIVFLSCSFSYAQSIQNVKASPLQNGIVTVTYDIVGEKANQKFIIELYGSNNNFTKPLIQVAGDVGKDITGGSGKRIIWSASDELSDYKGEISFRVKGSVIGMPFVFISPIEGRAIRRGKNTDLKWEGGTTNQIIKLELYKGNVQINAIAETKNSGTYNWNVPKNLEKGNYTVKLIAGQENVSSKVFVVKSKIPLLLKALPILAVGGAVIALGGGGSKGTGTPASSDLPVAPDPK